MCLRYGFIAVFIAVVFLRPYYSMVYALLILSRGHFLFIHQKLSLIVVHYLIPLFSIIVPRPTRPTRRVFSFSGNFPVLAQIIAHSAAVRSLSGCCGLFPLPGIGGSHGAHTPPFSLLP